MLRRVVVRTLVRMSLAATVLTGCGTSAGRPEGETDPAVPVTARAPGAATATSGRPTATVPAQPPARARGQIASGPVVFVSDGDTVGVRLSGVVTRIRLVGIDAPETKDPDLPTQCYGPQAAALAARLMPRGALVTVVTDPTQDRIDRFGRLLAYVFPAGNPRPVNVALVQAGAARVYVYRRSRPPKRLAELRRAERDARGARRGLWGACPRLGGTAL